MMPLEPLIAAFAGAIAGSFLATCAVRADRGEPAWRGRSRCDSCAAPVSALANVPIVSFVALRGRCSACGAAIDRRHPLLEVACAIIGAVSLVAAPGVAGWAGALFGWLLATLAVFDAWRFRLPDAIVLPLGLIGLGGGLAGLAPSLGDRVWGMAGGYAALSVVRLGYRALRGRDGLGRGDAKLLGAIGAWLGWQPLPWVVLAAATIGLGWTAARALAGARIAATDRLAFGALLALAAWPIWLVIV